MNISYRWLLDLAPAIEGAPGELADRLGMLGAPVDELTPLGEPLRDVVVARVEEVRPHPNADRLRLCTVNAGGGVLQVVCGAPNVEAGRFYPFAPVGASLPGGIEIRKAKLRGEVSEGMLCSARELGLGRDHAGLMALAGEWQPGASFVDALGLDDARLVLDITPNRPDLLSHLGVARELAPNGAADLALRPFAETPSPVDTVAGGSEVQAAGVRVRIASGDDCPRYMAAVLEGVEVGPSPEWLASRLRAIGARPINNVVDATNYVLHELGQPLHAFDLDRLAGAEIVVRRAGEGETIRTLDGVDRTLTESDLVIADGERPVALAGIMGGEESEVREGTSRVLLECALFHPLLVRKTARRLGLSTDASQRFERGVDPLEQPRALLRVAELILAVAGGRVAGPALDAHPAPHEPVVLTLRRQRVRQVLGIDFDADALASLLTPIGFTAERDGDALRVRVPGYRPDISREIDLVEEVARRHGYDSFESDLSGFRPGVVPPDPLLPVQAAVHAILVQWGFHEARTAAFAPATDGRLGLANPLSAEESHLRDDLVTGLLRRVEHNWSHGARAIRLYEIGSVFRPSAGAVAEEEIRVAAVFTGPRRPPHWSEPAAAWDEWDLKGLLGELAELYGAIPEAGPGGLSGLPFEDDIRFAVAAGAGVAGAGGRVLSAAVDAPAWADDVYALELVLRPRPWDGFAPFRALPAFPPADRDLALLLPAGTTGEQVEAAIRAAAPDLLASLAVFDVYEGKGLPEGMRSVAWRLRFRHPERTLTDSEVEQAVTAVLRRLQEELGVRRR